MNLPTSPTDAPQSFVIRVWRESPRQWRGSVRHVQSQAQRGFERLDQALGFMEQYVSQPSTPAQGRSRQPQIDLSWLRARRLQPVWALGGLAILLVLTLLILTPNANVPLAGAAVGQGEEIQIASAFVSGAVLGGVGVALWCRSKNHK